MNVYKRYITHYLAIALFVLLFIVGCGEKKSGTASSGNPASITGPAVTTQIAASSNGVSSHPLVFAVGQDVYIDKSLITYISSYSPVEPVFIASNNNGWFWTSIPADLSSYQLKLQSSGPYAGLYLAAGMNGIRFNLVQFTGSNINWCQIQAFAHESWYSTAGGNAILVSPGYMVVSPPNNLSAIPQNAESMGSPRINYESMPASYTGVTLWFQALTLSGTSQSNNLEVTVDWAEIYQQCGTSQATLLSRQDFLTDNAPYPLGGLFIRNPWYSENTRTSLVNSYVSGGMLHVNVGVEPGKISHWWISEVLPATPGCKYFGKARTSVPAGIGLQMGSDYFRNGDYFFPAENWIGSWVTNTNGFVNIELNY